MTAAEIREAEAAAGAANLVGRLGSLAAALEGIEAKDTTLATEGLDDSVLVDAAALVMDLRKRLGDVERDLVIAAGKRLGKSGGELSDGRLYVIARSNDRKEWDHDDWKRDVRRAIVAATPVVSAVDPDTGEFVDLAPILFDVIGKAQAVHGAQQPKSTALRALGLYASDYCTSSPAGWRLTVTPKPDPKPTTDSGEQK